MQKSGSKLIIATSTDIAEAAHGHSHADLVAKPRTFHWQHLAK